MAANKQAGRLKMVAKFGAPAYKLKVIRVIMCLRFRLLRLRLYGLHKELLQSVAAQGFTLRKNLPF